MSHRGLTTMESTSTASSMVLSTSSLSLASPTKERNKRGNHARKPSKDGLADSTDSREQSPRERPSSISQSAKESPRGKHSDLGKLVSPREGSSERKKKKHKDTKDETVASGAADTGSAELSFGGSGEGATTTSTTSSHAEKSLTKSKKSARSEYGSRRGISSTGDFRSRSVELSREESDISVPESSTLTTTSASKRHHHHKEVQEHTDVIVSPRSSSKKSHKSTKHHTVVDTYSSASALGYKDKDTSSSQVAPASASATAASGSLVSSVSSASFHAKTPGTRHRSGSSKQFGSSEDTRDSESLTVDFLDSDDDDDDTIQANKKDSDQSIDLKRHSGRTSPSSSAKTFKSSHSSNKSSPTSDVPLPPPLPPSTPKQKPPRAHRHSMMTTKRVETLRLADLPSHGFDGHTHKKKRERRRSNDLTESPMDDDDSPSPRGSSNSGSIDDPESGKMMKRKTWNKIPKNEELRVVETGPTTIDLVTEETYKAHRITPTPGYLIDTVRDEPGGGSSIAQQELAYERWLLDTFHSGSQEYTIHYVPVDNQPIDDILFITVKTEYAPDFKELIGIKILVTYEDRDQKIIISHAQLRASGKTILKGSSKRTVSVRKLLEYISPALNKHNVRRIRANSEILDGLLTLARLRLSYCHADKHFKVGALYWSGDKDDEETLSANGSPAFNEFISHLGEVVQLENWDKFAGGLDITSRSMDGKASLFTEWKGNQIMYHVAPLMECSAHQKRVHIGNDTLVVVFVDSKKNFKAEYIQSKFNQVFVVVSVETDESAIAKAIASSSSHSQHASASAHHHGHHIAHHTPPPSKTPLSLTLTPPAGSSGNNGIGISAGGSASTGKKRRVTSASTALSPLPDHSPTKESLSPRHTHGHSGSHVLSSSTRHGGSSEKTARSSSAFSNPTSRRDSLGSVDTIGTSRTENTQLGISPSSGGSLGTSGHSGGRSLPARSSPLEMELRESDEDSGAQGDDESPIKRSKLLGASSYSGSPLDSPLTLSNPPSTDLYSPHSAMSGSLPETPHSSRRTRSSSHLDDIPEIPYNQSSADSHATASSSTATMNTSSTEIPPVEDFPAQHTSLTASMPEFTSPSGKKKKRRGGSMLASGAPADSASVASNTAHSNPEIPSSRPPVVDTASSSSSAARRRNKHKDNSQVGSTTQSLPSDTWYRVSVLRRCGIDPFRPKLPFPAVLQAGPEFREWLLTKITSGMIAAFSSPNFQDRVQANRSTYLTNLCRAIEKVDF